MYLKAHLHRFKSHHEFHCVSKSHWLMFVWNNQIPQANESNEGIGTAETLFLGYKTYLSKYFEIGLFSTTENTAYLRIVCELPLNHRYHLF